MDVAIAGVVPYTLGFEFKGVQMRCLLIVRVGMGAAVATATYVTTDQANPEV